MWCCTSCLSGDAYIILICCIIAGSLASSLRRVLSSQLLLPLPSFRPWLGCWLSCYVSPTPLTHAHGRLITMRHLVALLVLMCGT